MRGAMHGTEEVRNAGASGATGGVWTAGECCATTHAAQGRAAGSFQW